MSQKLSGKVAVVTGGNSGIGLATAKQFALEEAQVFITGRRQGEIDSARNEFEGHGGAGRRLEARRSGSTYATVKQEVGRFDVLFANAGVAEHAMLGSITEDHFDKLFDINVKGVLFTVQKALPWFKNGGSITLNASITASKGLEAFSVYSATKAAVRSFARCWTSDPKSKGIRVSAISPGSIDTPAIVGLAPTRERISEFKGNLTAAVPLGRIGGPDETAKAAVFLASDDSSFVTGIERFVDGGMAQV